MCYLQICFGADSAVSNASLTIESTLSESWEADREYRGCAEWAARGDGVRRGLLCEGLRLLVLGRSTGDGDCLNGDWTLV